VRVDAGGEEGGGHGGEEVLLDSGPGAARGLQNGLGATGVDHRQEDGRGHLGEPGESLQTRRQSDTRGGRPCGRWTALKLRCHDAPNAKAVKIK